MKKAKIRNIIIICISAFLAFATLVIIGFYSILNNPVDNIAVPYIRQNVDLQNKYGEFVWIGRYHLYKTEKDESTIKKAYVAETESGDVIVYVTLIKKDGTWEAVSIEEIEVKPNDY